MNSSWPAISALIAFTCLSCTGNSLDPTPDGLTDYERRLYAHLVHGPTANEGRMTFFIDSVAHPEGREQPSKAVATMKVHPDSLEFIDTLRIYYGSDLELWFTDLDARVAIGGTVRGHVTGHLLGEKRGGHVLVEFREFTLTDSLISGRFGAGI